MPVHPSDAYVVPFYLFATSPRFIARSTGASTAWITVCQRWETT